MAKNNKSNEGDNLRILTELVKELSRLDEQKRKVIRAEKAKTKAIQNVLHRIIEENKEEDGQIYALLQNMQKSISTLKALLK